MNIPNDPFKTPQNNHHIDNYPHRSASYNNIKRKRMLSERIYHKHNHNQETSMSKQQNISHCKDNNVVDYQRSFSQHKQNKTPLTVMDNHIQSRTVIESNNYESYSYHPTPERQQIRNKIQHKSSFYNSLEPCVSKNMIRGLIENQKKGGYQVKLNEIRAEVKKRKSLEKDRSKSKEKGKGNDRSLEEESPIKERNYRSKIDRERENERKSEREDYINRYTERERELERQKGEIAIERELEIEMQLEKEQERVRATETDKKKRFRNSLQPETDHQKSERSEIRRQQHIIPQSNEHSKQQFSSKQAKQFYPNNNPTQHSEKHSPSKHHITPHALFSRPIYRNYDHMMYMNDLQTEENITPSSQLPQSEPRYPIITTDDSPKPSEYIFKQIQPPLNNHDNPQHQNQQERIEHTPSYNFLINKNPRNNHSLRRLRTFSRENHSNCKSVSRSRSNVRMRIASCLVNNHKEETINITEMTKINIPDENYQKEDNVSREKLTEIVNHESVSINQLFQRERAKNQINPSALEQSIPIIPTEQTQQRQQQSEPQPYNLQPLDDNPLDSIPFTVDISKIDVENSYHPCLIDTTNQEIVLSIGQNIDQSIRPSTVPVQKKEPYNYIQQSEEQFPCILELLKLPTAELKLNHLRANKEKKIQLELQKFGKIFPKDFFEIK